MVRRLPVGAEVRAEGVHFRVWAPERKRVELVIEPDPGPVPMGELIPLEMHAEGNGYFSLLSPEAAAGSLYRFRLDNGDLYADPASRFQPVGPHGSSQVIDPRPFRWSDEGWRGIRPEKMVVYEMHIGTFTPEGNWSAAAAELGRLADLGITAVEVMPVAEFPGRFGWGYDGVNLFAPTRLYGTPDDFRSFVDAAHAAGIAVILDVVYNHLGPEGNYLKQYSDCYFTHRYLNEWGEAIDFDGPGAGPVREFFRSNAAYWISEFHLDGLRLDATQQIFDRSPKHILQEIAEAARRAAAGRSIFLVAENEPEDVRFVRPPERGGYGLDAMWNEDYHHAVLVALTGYNEAYYSEYLGTPQEVISAVKRGFLYQGQRYFWQEQRRGSCTRGLAPSHFVHFMQNHDQIANSARGERIHLLTSPGLLKAATALLLLGPQIPMLFQGQEFAASSPFLYFADLNVDIARLVRRGRIDFLMQFSNLASPEIVAELDNPSDEDTFRRSKLDPSERERNSRIYALHRDLLALRRTDPVFSAAPEVEVDGAVLGTEALVLRFFGKEEDRLLLVNLGRDLRLRPVPEPLLAPPEGSGWSILWSSEHPRYGGNGTPELETEQFWRVPAHSAVVLAPSSAEEYR